MGSEIHYVTVELEVCVDVDPGQEMICNPTDIAQPYIGESVDVIDVNGIDSSFYPKNFIDLIESHVKDQLNIR